MKKILGLSTLALAGVLAFTGCSCGKDDDTNLPALPAARLTEDGCTTNTFDHACSTITAKNLPDYLGRSDVTYIDLRGHSEYAPYELKGFEHVQFNQDIMGDSSQLFTPDYLPRYSYSVERLEQYFPKDKTLFIMCGVGARVAKAMTLLEMNGWDMSKIYNIGGTNQIQALGEEDYKKYEDYVIAYDKTNIASSYKSATVNFDGGYSATAYVAKDAQGKITSVYLRTNGEYTDGVTDGWNQDTWVNARYEYLQSLIGKTADDIEEMIGDEGAEGADVVTGATLSSNRTLEAVLAALNAQ